MAQEEWGADPDVGSWAERPVRDGGGWLVGAEEEEGLAAPVVRAYPPYREVGLCVL